jgi:Methyltransferase domain
VSPAESTPVRSLLDSSTSWKPAQLTDALLAAEGRWASKLLQGRSVVDITPGISSATSELALGAESLVIVSPRVAITELLRERSEPESGFEVRLAEPSDMPFDEGSFGAAVFFEVGRSTAGEIEGVLREVERVLDNKDGLLITSLGVPSVRTVQSQGVLKTLTATLEKLFSNVSVVELTISLTATFSSAPTAAALEAGRGSDAGERPVLDAIVVASNGQLPDFRTSSALSFPVDLELWEQSREALLETVRISQARAARAERMADEREYLIRELFAVEQMLSSEFDLRRRREISPRTASLFRAQLEALGQAQAEIADLRTSTSWRITKPLRLLKEILR